MNHFKITSILIIAVSTLGLHACVSTTKLTKQQNFIDYLDQFKGKSQEALKSEINFKQFGVDSTKMKISKQDPSIIRYTIHRPVMIPTPIFEPNFTGGGGSVMGGGISASGMKSSLPTANSSYHVDMTCDITFHLENQIVTSWETKGKAC